MTYSSALAGIRTRLLSSAAADERIVAVMDDGSGAHGSADEFSDLDVAVFVRDDEFDAFSAAWKSWAAGFGPLLLAYGGRWSATWAVYDTEPLPSRVDFSLLPAARIPDVGSWAMTAGSLEAMVLYDPSGALRQSAAALLGKSLRPAGLQEVFDAECGDFWYFALFVYSKLMRGDAWVARQVFHSEVMDHLFRLLRIEAGGAALERWEWEKNAYGVERTLSPERLERLDACVPGLGARGVTLALAAAVALGGEVSATIASREGWPWPDKLAARVHQLTRR